MGRRREVSHFLNPGSIMPPPSVLLDKLCLCKYADELALEDDLNIPKQKCKCQDAMLAHELQDICRKYYHHLRFYRYCTCVFLQFIFRCFNLHA